MLAVTAMAGCKKPTDIPVTNIGKIEVPEPPLVRPSLPPLKLTFNCVGSYEELFSAFGASSLPVKQIVLEDNTVILPDGILLRVDYALQPSSGGNSAFDSLLWIRYLQGSLIRTHYSQVWSLGCPLKVVSGGPYTNLQRGGQTYEVNTSFTWTAPPYGSDGPKIKYLVLD